MLRQGRLELKGEGVGYPCDRCGKSIKSGRFCDSCQAELKNGFNEAFGGSSKDAPAETTETSDRRGMHIKKNNR